MPKALAPIPGFRVTAFPDQYCSFFVRDERQDEKLDQAYADAINKSLDSCPKMEAAIRDIVMSSNANDSGSLMNAIQAASELIDELAPATPDLKPSTKIVRRRRAQSPG